MRICDLCKTVKPNTHPITDYGNMIFDPAIDVCEKCLDDLYCKANPLNQDAEEVVQRSITIGEWSAIVIRRALAKSGKVLHENAHIYGRLSEPDVDVISPGTIDDLLKGANISAKRADAMLGIKDGR